MKKFISLTMAATLAMGTTAFAADVNVAVGGTSVAWTDARPFISKDNRTLVPLRPIADALDLDVEWDKEKRTAIFSDGEVAVAFVIDSNTYYVATTLNTVGSDVFTSAEELEMDTAAVISDARTYAPARYLAEAFGYTVGWDKETKSVTIDFAEEVVEDVTEEIVAGEEVADEIVTGEEVADEIVTGEEVADEEVVEEIVAGNEALNAFIAEIKASLANGVEVTEEELFRVDGPYNHFEYIATNLIFTTVDVNTLQEKYNSIYSLRLYDGAYDEEAEAWKCSLKVFAIPADDEDALGENVVVDLEIPVIIVE